MEAYNHKFKVTLHQQAILLARLILFWVFFTLIVKYYLKRSLFGIGATFVIPFFLLVDTMPTIILHIQYLIKNYGAIFIINTDSKALTYETSSGKVSYSFNDIASLHYYRTYGKGSGWSSFGMYRYYKIIFHDTTEINITCLMINDIEHTLEMLLRMESEKHFKLLCLV